MNRIKTWLWGERGVLFGIIMISALFEFEVFNFSTTEFALSDLMGELGFMGIRWATILAVAFVGIDFAGIARLFTPKQGANEPMEIWFLFGAWLLAATMNAMLTWWGVSVAILNHESLGSAMIARETLLRAVPIFVAVMVWLIRIFLIGTFSITGDRLFSQAETRQKVEIKPRKKSSAATAKERARAQSTRPDEVDEGEYHPTPKPRDTGDRPESTYHPINPGGNGNASVAYDGSAGDILRFIKGVLSFPFRLGK